MSKTVSSVLTEVLEQYKPVPSNPPNILQALLHVQTAIGHVPEEAVGRIAHTFDVSEADVAGVLSYYPDLRKQPTGRHLVRSCQGESCVANHSAEVMRACQRLLGVDPGQTTPDGRFSLEKVYCVGNCGLSPTVTVDDDVHGRVAPSDVPALLERYE